MSYFSDLKKELEEDLKLNVVIMKDKQERRPQILIKWFWRFAEAKKDVLEMEAEREELKNRLLKSFDPQIKLTKAKKEELIAETDEVKKLDKAIKVKNQEVEILAESVSAIKSFAFDIKALIEITKLEKI